MGANVISCIQKSATSFVATAVTESEAVLVHVGYFIPLYVLTPSNIDSVFLQNALCTIFMVHNGPQTG